MEFELRRYLFPTEGIAWTRGLGQPAGVYLMGDRVHVAAYGSPAEADLVARGAVHMAALRFDAETGERWHPRRAVVRVPAAQLVGAMGGG